MTRQEIERAPGWKLGNRKREIWDEQAALPDAGPEFMRLEDEWSTIVDELDWRMDEARSYAEVED